MPDTTPSPTALEYIRLEGPREYEQALDRLISLARGRLRIFDQDLRNQGYNSQERFDSLRQFLLQNRANRLTIILHDDDYLIRECPRMLNLIRQFGHAIDVYRTTEDARGVYDPFAIADMDHYLHRFHYDHPRAALTLNDKEGASDLLRRFNEILEVAESAVPSTTLGL
jgi:hypothetical protein